MDIKPTNDQSISDDQELAKVLAGVSAQADDQATVSTQPAAPVAAAPAPAVDQPAVPVEEQPVVEPESAAAPVALSGDLDSIKQAALGELRPLVDKLDVAPDEKFDTYLLLLRSTDDSSLIGPAHEAAKNIPDETRRAQALLDVIKEIDYLAHPNTQQ